MQWLSPTLLAIQVISSLAIIVLVLLQQGKGSEMGSAFGSGSAGSLFGASGAANFLSRTTKWAAILFFATTGGLAYVAHHPGSSALDTGVMQGFKSAPAQAPATGSAVPSIPGSAAAPQGSPDSSKGQPNAVSPAAGSTQPDPKAAANSSAAVPSVPAPAAPAPKTAEPSSTPASPDKSGVPAKSK
jgi:preprotein translocase subunit SecG